MHRCNRKEKQMEHKFGIFESYEELNRAAAAQKAEGDREAVIALALENGLEKEDAEDYLETEDTEWELCNAAMAALGKLKLEEEELGITSQLKDWKDFLSQLILEEETGELAGAVFSPGRHLAEALAAGIKKASQNRVRVPEEIFKKTGLPETAAWIGMCGRDELRTVFTDYYLGEGGKG